MDKSQAMALFNKAIKRISRCIREIYLKEAEHQFDSKIKGNKAMKNVSRMGPSEIETTDIKEEYKNVHNQVYPQIEDELLKKRDNQEQLDERKKQLLKLKAKSKKIKGNPNYTLDVSLEDDDLKKLKIEGGSFVAKKKAM